MDKVYARRRLGTQHQGSGGHKNVDRNAELCVCEYVCGDAGKQSGPCINIPLPFIAAVEKRKKKGASLFQR